MSTEEPTRTVIPKMINRIITMNNANPIALRYEDPSNLSKMDKLANWKTYNYFEYIEMIHKIGRALITCEIEVTDGISIYGSNCPEWLLVFLATIGCGARTVGIYPTDTVDQITFKVKDSNSKIVFVENNSKCQLLLPLLDTKIIRKIIIFDFSERVIDREDVCYFDQFLEFDDLNNQFEIIKRQKNMDPDDICCYVYTSGTTGNPKGVMISHDNLFFEAKIMTNILPNFKNNKEQRIISYLPLSHIAGLLIDIICPLVAASEGKNINVNFARSDDLKSGNLVERIKIISPTIFFGVPRVWEKMKEKIELSLSESNSTKQKIINWSRNTSSQNKRNPLSFFSKSILNRVKTRLGLDKCQVFMSGAAPLSDEVFNFYQSINIEILELYGMSECTGAISCNLPNDIKNGCVGKVIPHCQIKIINNGMEIEPIDDVLEVLPEQEGELCFKGRNVMSGYWANPKDEDNYEIIKTKNDESLQNGWIHSGDKGCVDKEGYVRITGRYKDIIIGSGGENISPFPIESKIKEECPLVDQVVMIGDSRKFNIALMTLNTDVKNKESDQNCQDSTKFIICKEIEEELELEKARQDKRVQEMIYKSICNTNENGNVCKNNCYKIQKFCILKEGFSVEGGELTSTLKIRRDYINNKYQDIINQVYECPQEYYYYE